ncbi:MAG: hypothetical protein ACYCSO_02825 [Cuniculiplasma sp.]
MRGKVVRIGLVLIVVGIIMVVAGIGLTSDYLTVSHNYVRDGTMYRSQEINITSDGLVALNGNSTFYLIHANNISLVNKTNVGNYSIASTGPTHNGFGNEFLVGAGSYYLVSFLAPSSGVVYSFTSNFSTFTDLGIILLLGLFLIVISIIILIAGFLLKNKSKPPMESMDLKEL